MTAKGVLIAASVAGLFSAATPLIASADATAGDVTCEGINACKGKDACKGASHECAGKNACKGKGWVKTTAADCKAKGGKVVGAK